MPWARPVSPTPGLAAGAGVYALYAIADIAAREGTELDRAVASAGSHLPASAIVAGTASHPGLAINGRLRWPSSAAGSCCAAC